MDDVVQMDGFNTSYLDLLPPQPLGDHESGEIEIITDADFLAGDFADWASSRGMKPPFNGVVYEDRYIAVVRDAVRFPSRSLGNYIRVLQTPLDRIDVGAIVLPFDGERVCFIRTFRHAIRAWSLELPRGGVEPSEEPVDAARRELRQETGLKAMAVRPVGVLHPDTGLIGSGATVVLARVEPSGDESPLLEISEAVSENRWLSKLEYLGLLAAGDIRDSLSISAVALGMAHGMWGPDQE